MSDPQHLDRLRHALQERRAHESAAAARGPDCLDEDVLAALADGHLDHATRAAALEHVATCSRCRGIVASVARALGDAAVARQVRAVEGPHGRRFLRIAIPTAAAAALLLLAWPPPPLDEEPHRAPTITAAPAPAGMWPAGASASVEALRWASVPGADRYRVTLFDAQGQVLLETQLGDTVAVLPDSIVLVGGRRYLWKVEARTGFDRWTASELVEFSIAGETPR